MSKFIKLTNLMINANYIHSIVIKPNKYCINVISNKLDGFQFSAVGGFGIGGLYSNNCEIEVCETNNANDYKTISKWIDKH